MVKRVLIGNKLDVGQGYNEIIVVRKLFYYNGRPSLDRMGIAVAIRYRNYIRLSHCATANNA